MRDKMTSAVSSSGMAVSSSLFVQHPDRRDVSNFNDTFLFSQHYFPLFRERVGMFFEAFPTCFLGSDTTRSTFLQALNAYTIQCILVEDSANIRKQLCEVLDEFLVKNDRKKDKNIPKMLENTLIEPWNELLMAEKMLQRCEFHGILHEYQYEQDEEDDTIVEKKKQYIAEREMQMKKQHGIQTTPFVRSLVIERKQFICALECMANAVENAAQMIDSLMNKHEMVHPEMQCDTQDMNEKTPKCIPCMARKAHTQLQEAKSERAHQKHPYNDMLSSAAVVLHTALVEFDTVMKSLLENTDQVKQNVDQSRNEDVAECVRSMLTKKIGRQKTYELLSQLGDQDDLVDTVRSNPRITSVLSTKERDQLLRESMGMPYGVVHDIMLRNSDVSHPANRKHLTYAQAGVDIDAGDLMVQRIKPIVKSTKRVGASSELGGFGGLFDLAATKYHDPILVSGTDGVGTKLFLAKEANKHDTIGIDLVAMSVNDVLVQGAEPLFFLDYFATSKLDVDIGTAVVTGVAKGCIESGCALVGGETAELPGLYQPGDYDLAGFAVGVVERSELLPRMDDICEGDVLLGLLSSGLHSNGFSLARKCVNVQKLDWHAPAPYKSSEPSLIMDFLKPTKLYVKSLLPILRQSDHGGVRALAHITGGGLVDNLPRVLPDHIQANINLTSYLSAMPPVFAWINRSGVPANEMIRTFNCGIGMVIVVKKYKVNTIIESLSAVNEPVFIIGSLCTRKEGPSVLVDDLDAVFSS